MSEPLITAEQLVAVLHAQAHALMLARPALTAEAALAQVTELAVTVYDTMTVEAALRKAAADRSVPDTLAMLFIHYSTQSSLCSPNPLTRH